MTTAAWPSTIPQCPILNGLSEQRQRNVASFAPDVGPPKLRRRSTAACVQTTVVFKMSNAELVTFNTFYETTLADGTLPFTWLHPRTKTSYSWMFASEEAPTIERLAPNANQVLCKLLRLP